MRIQQVVIRILKETLPVYTRIPQADSSIRGIMFRNSPFRVCHTTAATTVIFRTLLSSSTSDRSVKSRWNPLRGLILSNFGASAWVEKTNPIWR